jgi:Golgi phosphoprotein 3 (GPP34)
MPVDNRRAYGEDMLIAEDLLLLLYDDETGKPVTGSPGLDYALAGAVVIELTMQGKVDVTGPGDPGRPGRLKLVDDRPTDDPVLDERLAILTGKEGKKPKDVIGRLSKKLRDQLLYRLAQRGILEADRDRVLGLFPVTRWPAKDAHHEAEVRAALENVLKLGTRPDERTGALIALLSALNVVPKIVTDTVDKKALNRRAKEIAESDWAAEAVRKAVHEMQAAVTTAIIAGTTTAAAGGSN